MPKFSPVRTMLEKRKMRQQQLLRRKERFSGPKFEKNGKHFQQQNRLRVLLERVRPRAMKPQQEFGTGVDFVFAGKKIDFKFGFGTLGQDTISVRMNGNELINKSDWTMVCNERGDIMIFGTDRVRDYVKMNRSKMKQNMFLNKGTYTLHRISLAEMLGDARYPGNIRSGKHLLKALKKMNRVDNPNMPAKSPFLHAVPTKADRVRLAQSFSRMGAQPQRPKFDRRIGR
jgi:hypothetical protein